MLKVFITGSVQLLARVAKGTPELRRHCDVVTLLCLGAEVKAMLGERAVAQHAHTKWKGHELDGKVPRH